MYVSASLTRRTISRVVVVISRVTIREVFSTLKNEEFIMEGVPTARQLGGWFPRVFVEGTFLLYHCNWTTVWTRKLRSPSRPSFEKEDFVKRKVGSLGGRETPVGCGFKRTTFFSLRDSTRRRLPDASSYLEEIRVICERNEYNRASNRIFKLAANVMPNWFTFDSYMTEGAFIVQ